MATFSVIVYWKNDWPETVGKELDEEEVRDTVSRLMQERAYDFSKIEILRHWKDTD